MAVMLSVASPQAHKCPPTPHTQLEYCPHPNRTIAEPKMTPARKYEARWSCFLV